MTKESVKAQSGRVRRTPITMRARLAVKDTDPNFHYRIVNVKDDRVEQFQEQGYEIVPKAVSNDKFIDTATPLGSAGEFSVGGGMKAVVMRIPKEYFVQDQAAKQASIDELEATMKFDAIRGK